MKSVNFVCFFSYEVLTQISAFDIHRFQETKRWLCVFVLSFPEYFDRTILVDKELLLSILKLDPTSLTLDSLVPDTDVNHERAPNQINQGRWLPRGGKRNNLVAIVKNAVGEIKYKPGPHPYSNWMKEFNWQKIPSCSDVFNFVPAKRAVRKREQILNIVAACLSIATPGSVIVDFCSGGGHVGLLIAHLLPSCEIILLDNKLESLQQAEKRVEEGALTNVSMFHCSIEQFKGRFDIGISLHACGPSTDIVLSMCFEKKAAFVICPCCYGSIRFAQGMKYPRSDLFCENDITAEEFYSLTKVICV